MMVTLSRMFPWRDALVNVKADTLLRWHRKGFRLFWRWKSQPTGRPRLPGDLRDLIRKMAAENPIWGEERIANELKMKLGIRVSPRTVAKYLNSRGPRREPDPKQRWLTFVRNHAKAIVACDFFVVVTASFRILYVFVIMELGTRRILHHNVTAHPTAEWTLQQFRKALPGDHPYRFLIHDRDSIFSRIWPSKWSRWVCACCEPRSGRPPRELRMRALRRDPTPRVPGLSDPDQRTASQDC